MCTPKVVDAKPAERTAAGKAYQHMLTQLHLFNDKCDVEARLSLDAGMLRVANVGWRQWLRRTSKAVLAIHATYEENKDMSDAWNSAEKAKLYQRTLALQLVLLEACAMYGIHCHHPDGAYDLWPISWVFWTDRDEQVKLTGVHKAPQGT